MTIAVGAQGDEHTLGVPSAPYRFAHVQIDAAGHQVARILCGRRLQPATDYLAIVVPAFDASGARSWTGAAPVTIPAFDAWRFRTAVPAGSFEDLAARLHPGDAPATTGRAPLRYPRLADSPPLEVLGALVAATPGGPATDGPLPAGIEQDLAALQLPARDQEGRPIVAMPRYGEAWNTPAPAGTAWGKSLNSDPRHRGVAGLGLEIGIRSQEDLVSDVLAHLGALREARQRVQHAVMGVATSRSLWWRRVPSDAGERLWLLGPSLRRLMTDTGPVADLASADDRTMPAGTFSAAARRILRSGPARTPATTAPRQPAAVLAAANRPPGVPPSTTDGVPLNQTAMATFDRNRKRTIQLGHVATAPMLAAAQSLAAQTDTRLRPAVTQIVTAMQQAAQAGHPVPWGEAMTMLASCDATVVARMPNPSAIVTKLTQDLSTLRTKFVDRADDRDLTDLLSALSPLSADDPSLRAVDVDTLSFGVAAAFDPTPARPPVIDRVLRTIQGGVDPQQPLAPPEPCVGLDRAAWADVDRAFDEWLLPGVADLNANAVVSLESNPVFIDALLAGLNTQLLAELRWRNIPIATGCTPIRRFWDRADTATGTRVDDIVGVAAWSTDSPLGDATHRAPGVMGRELVIAVRGDLFRRYPTTIVYLKTAQHGSPPATNFDADPDDTAQRVLPGFQGRLGEDVAFFGFPALPAAAVVDYWVVFEEPPAGYRFANDAVTSAVSGDAWAAATLAQPVRVIIRGDALIPGGH